MKGKLPVLITTDKDKKGVFFGYIKKGSELNDPLEVFGAQMCLYWAESVRGVLGLVVDGPNSECRITKTNKERFIIKGIDLVAQVSEKAEKNWLKQGK